MAITDLLPWYWRWLALAAIMAGSIAFGAVQMRGYDVKAFGVERAGFATFRAQITVATLAAIKQRDSTIATYQNLKRQADAEIARVHTVDAVSIGKLRHDLDAARADGQFVPAAASTAGDPGRACFDRTALESAIRGLFADVRAGADKCRAVEIDLNGARTWAGTITSVTPAPTPAGTP